MKHSNNNREALTRHKCIINNGTSAPVTSSAGIFWRAYCPWAVVSQNMPAHFCCSERSLIYPVKLSNCLN